MYTSHLQMRRVVELGNGAKSILQRRPRRPERPKPLGIHRHVEMHAPGVCRREVDAWRIDQFIAQVHRPGESPIG